MRRATPTATNAAHVGACYPLCLCYVHGMSDQPHNLIFDVLKQIQAGFADVRARLDRLEEINRKQRRASAGILVMMRATASDFDARVGDVEEHVSALESAGRI